MSNEALVTELKSGFISTLYQLLEPIHTADDVKSIKPEQLKLRLTLSIKTIDYLLTASQKLTLQEWESTVSPGLCAIATIFTVLYRLCLHCKSTFLDLPSIQRIATTC